MQQPQENLRRRRLWQLLSKNDRKFQRVTNTVTEGRSWHGLVPHTLVDCRKLCNSTALNEGWWWCHGGWRTAHGSGKRPPLESRGCVLMSATWLPWHGAGLKIPTKNNNKKKLETCKIQKQEIPRKGEKKRLSPSLEINYELLQL